MTRAEAKAAGLKRYHGKVCAKHPELEGERRTTNGSCVECARSLTRRLYKVNAESHREYRKAKAEHYREWRKANAETLAEWQREYYRTNAEKIKERVNEYRKTNAEWKREYDRKYREANAEKIAECLREWRKANVDKCRALHAKRRARLRAAIIPLTLAEQKQISALYAHARRLNEIAGDEYHIDHIVPLKKGGLHHPDNLRVVRGVDNLRKGTRSAAAVPVAFELRV